MRRYTLPLAATLVLASSAAHAQNLITNGDFSGGLTGWSNSAGNVSTHTIGGAFGEVVEVGVGDFNTSLFQSFTLAVPSTLGISFNLGVYRDTLNGFGVSSGPWTMGISLEDSGATTVWSSTADAFNATQSGIYTPELSISKDTTALPAGTYTLRFTSPTGHGWTILDNISVTAAPEPGTLVLLGLGGLCLARRRRPL